jgi:hypothetical protein
MFGRFTKYLHKDEEGNMVLQGVGVLVGLVCLVALGGLLANSFTNAAALPDGNAFNVSSTTSTYYPIVITISFVACLALIGLPVLAMMLAYFNANGSGKR